MGSAGGLSDRELLRAVLAGSPVRIALIDRDLKFVLAPDPNPPLASDGGAPTGASVADVYGELPGVLDGVRSAFEGEPGQLTFERGGAVYTVALTPHRDERGEVDSVVAVASVCLHGGTLERVLAQAQARERRVFHSSMVGLLYWDEAGAVVDANDALLAITGHTREDLMLGRLNWRKLTPPGYEELDAAAIEELRTKGSCAPYEKEYVRKDGERVPILIGGSTWALGQLAGVAFVVDLTERKRRERDLEATEARLRRVVDLAPIVLWAVDAAGTFTLSTGRGLQALGLAPDQVVGKSAFDVYAGVPEIVNAIKRGLAGEELAQTLEVGSLAFDSLITPLRDDGGEIEGLLGVSIDVTEKRRAELQQQALETQLLEVQKLESLGLLAGGIAHDFNNILSVILGGASNALASLPPESPARADLDSVIAAAQRAAGLTHQMLAYAGKARVEIRPIDLSTHVREIAALLETTMSKKVELRLDLESNLPQIEADVAQVQQIVMNLVINGADAIGDRPGTIQVTTGLLTLDAAQAGTVFAGQALGAGRYVFLEVQDTGQGMDEATKAKIFDPFFTTKFTGRGLGLAAVHGIVRAHRAAIQVESSPGRGTTFRVLFPSLDTPAPARVSPSPFEYRGHGLALVIDDDAAVRAVVGRMLRFFGFSVVEAPDGLAGTEVFAQRTGEIAVVVVDMTMPEMNGEETFTALRGLRPDVPIVLVSGYDELEATRRLTREGPAAFLRKPFSPAELAAKLVEVLKVSASLPGGRAPGRQ